MVNRRVGNMRKESGGKKGGFFSRYRPPASDHVKRQGERRGGKFDSIFKGNFDTFTPKEGDNTIRILPAGWEGNDDYAYQVWIHWGIGADESAYLCLRKMKGETCPICQEVARMKADGEGEDAKRIDCKERFICWVIDRTDRDETPSLYSMPAQVYKDLNALCYSSKTGKAIFVDNPDDGYDVIIRRTGTKLNTKYLPSVERDATAVTDDSDKYKELEDWVQDNQVPECLQFFDTDYLEKALSGQIDRNADDEDDEKGSRKSSRRSSRDEDDEDERPRRGKSRRDDDEDEERPARKGKGRKDEDDEVDEDDLDDELPFDDDDESENEGREARQDKEARRRKGREDDDEDDDEEDEAEDEPPPRGKKGRSRDEVDEDEEDDRPARRKARDDDEDEEENPRGRTRVRDKGGRSAGNRRV